MSGRMDHDADRGEGEESEVVLERRPAAGAGGERFEVGRKRGRGWDCGWITGRKVILRM